MSFLRDLFGGRKVNGSFPSGQERAQSRRLTSEEQLLKEEQAALDRDDPSWDAEARLAGAISALLTGMDYRVVSQVYGEATAVRAREAAVHARSKTMLIARELAEMSAFQEAADLLGLRMERVDDIEQALGLAEKLVDVVVADVRMPVMDGVAFLRRLRAGGRARARCRVLAVSSFEGGDEVARSADAYVAKDELSQPGVLSSKLARLLA